VLETGAYLGYTTEVLGKAVRPHGHVDALEMDPELAYATELRCKNLPVTVYCTDSADFVPATTYDFMFFDSGMEARIDEMKRFRDHASDRCIFAIHDSRGHWIQQALRHLGAAHVNLPTPRGITIGRYQ
jgi:predicted O-methyltransferase YrrM